MKTLNEWITENEKLCQGYAPHTPSGRLRIALKIIQAIIAKPDGADADLAMIAEHIINEEHHV